MKLSHPKKLKKITNRTVPKCIEWLKYLPTFYRLRNINLRHAWIGKCSMNGAFGFFGHNRESFPQNKWEKLPQFISENLWNHPTCTLPETNIASENRPCQNKIHLATIDLQGPPMWGSRRVAFLWSTNVSKVELITSIGFVFVSLKHIQGHLVTHLWKHVVHPINKIRISYIVC